MRKTSVVLGILLLLLCLAGCGLQLEAPQTVSRETLEGLQTGLYPAPAPEVQPDPAPVPQPAPQPAPQPVPVPQPTEAELRQVRAEEILANMTTEQQVGQVLIAHSPGPYGDAAGDMEQLQLGGWLLFKRDFQDKSGNWLTAEAFADQLERYGAGAAITPFFGTDEEGGPVVRASQNPNLFPEGPCLSAQKLYKQGGLEALLQDATEKSATLLSHGINLNFAPVVDVSTNSRDFIYPRTLGQDAQTTADYAAAVTEQLKTSGVGAVLKHFPGYGNNRDTHTGVVTDVRPWEQFESCDLLPFKAGIEAGASAVLVSHNIVTCLDGNLPASLSPAVYDLLRQELSFTGVAITDDLAMDAVEDYARGNSAAVMALQAGADMVLTDKPEENIAQVCAALESGELPLQRLQEAVLRILLWKLELGVIQ